MRGSLTAIMVLAGASTVSSIVHAESEPCEAEEDAALPCASGRDATVGRLGGLDFAIGLWAMRPSTRGSIGASAPSGAAWRIPMSTLSPISETMIDFQTRFYVATPIYFGTDAAVGWARSRALSGTYDDSGTPAAFATDGHGMAMTLTATIGALLFESTTVDLRTEVAFGVHALGIDLTTPQGCTDGDGNAADCSFVRFDFLAEPRIAADFWLMPWRSPSGEAWMLGPSAALRSARRWPFLSG